RRFALRLAHATASRRPRRACRHRGHVRHLRIKVGPAAPIGESASYCKAQLNSALESVTALSLDFNIPARWKKGIDEIHADIVLMSILIEEDMLAGSARAHSDCFDPNRSYAVAHFLK